MLSSIIIKAFRGVIWCLCRILPVDKNKLFVSNFFGRGYGDNPKYIIEVLRTNRPELKIFWAVKSLDVKNTLPKDINACLIGSFSMIYHLTTSAVWIDNNRKPVRYKKKKQLYIQTWHGGGIVKKVERQIIDYLDHDYIKMAIKDAAYTDIMISDGRLQSEYYYKYYWFKGRIAQIGSPRNDCLFKDDITLISEKVKNYFNISSDKQILIYAPTFRKDWNFDFYNIDFQRLSHTLKDRFNKEFVILLRLHPGITKEFPIEKIICTNVIDASGYPDMQELILASDIMISDYSSVIFDFALTLKPAFRFASDIDTYETDRGGLCFPIEEYPYPLARNNDELNHLILNFDYNNYKHNLNKFFDKIGEVKNDHASADCAKLITDFVDSHLNKEYVFLNNKDILLNYTDFRELFLE